MRYSISSFVYYRYSLEKTIEKVADLGYQGIEIWGGRPHAYAEDMSPKRCESVRQILEDTGLELPCFIPAQFRYPTNLACSDQSIRLASVDYIRRSADVAASLGAHFCSICPGFSFYGERLTDNWQYLLSSLKQILEHSAQLPLKMVLEPAHSMETDLVLTVADGLRMLDDLGTSQLGLLPDTGHLHINREPLGDTLAPLIGSDIPLHIQVDDNHGSSDDHLVPGEGNLDFTPLFRCLDKHNYEGFLGVEIGWKYTCDPDPAALRSLQVLQLMREKSCQKVAL